MWAAITSHAHIWGFHGNVHIAWGVYYIGIIILHLIPCTLQNIEESVLVCLELKLCQSHALVRLRMGLLSTVYMRLADCNRIHRIILLMSIQSAVSHNCSLVKVSLGVILPMIPFKFQLLITPLQLWLKDFKCC